MGLQGRYFRQRQIPEATVKTRRQTLRARRDRDAKRTRDPGNCGQPQGVDLSDIAGPFAALNADLQRSSAADLQRSSARGGRCALSSAHERLTRTFIYTPGLKVFEGDQT